MRAKLDMKTMSAIATQDMTLSEHANAPDFGFHKDCFCITDDNRALILNSAPSHHDVWWGELHTQIQNLPPVKHEKHDLDEKLERALRNLGLNSRNGVDQGKSLSKPLGSISQKLCDGSSNTR